MKRFPLQSLPIVAIGLLGAAQAWATIPYSPVASTPVTIGPGVATPSQVTGKEYSHDADHSAAPPGGLADPEQVVLWDGIGGTADGADFSGSRPTWTPDDQVDAIAHHVDFLINPLQDDLAHLIFSHDDEVTAYAGAIGHFPVTIPAAGPVMLTNGNLIGGAGEVSIEHAGAFAPPSTQTVWATQSMVNGMPLPRDVDGLEIWGPEPVDDLSLGDADKYSLELDFFSGVSVWNASGTPYLGHGAVVSVVTSLLGPLSGFEVLPYDNADGEGVVNLDALMVNEVVGDLDNFDGDLAGGAGGYDTVLFSIRQVIDPTDPDGYYATGSEIFYLNGDGTFGFLTHGGHAWDHAYALGGLGVVAPDGDLAIIDVNAIEAVAQVPEPAGLALLAGCLASIAALRWRLG